jgi:hypothetical protein
MLPGLMRRPTLACLLCLALLVSAGPGCDDQSDPPATSTTATTGSTTTVPVAGEDAALTALLLGPSDLPSGFAASDDVDDTITSFCAAEDATAGLQASAREVRGFTRGEGGASVLQLAFRFEDDGATRFVTQAEGALGRCSGVPDASGLAFEYDALSPGLETALGSAAEAVVGRHGINVGSGSLSIDLVVLRHGDVGQLVAVLGVDLPRADLDALAATAFTAVADRIVAGGSGAGAASG